MAPEAVRGEIGPKVDVWALGITAHYMLVGSQGRCPPPHDFSLVSPFLKLPFWSLLFISKIEVCKTRGFFLAGLMWCSPILDTLHNTAFLIVFVGIRLQINKFLSVKFGMNIYYFSAWTSFSLFLMFRLLFLCVKKNYMTSLVNPPFRRPPWLIDGTLLRTL